ncbi:hypothetical protein SPD57_09230 [Streptococcus sp. BJSWXB6CM1]|uniref:Uncharacterized protein n=1 Tax=Streptococcus fermentans TaxID=3095082 RepID=A0ABU5G090_9STRE|nr:MULTISPECIES: hypothetical protein [unclassified Streptococcus]MDY4346607.1 hypothetical protein [Streptococcus sp. BJSWXB5TM5]MDY4361906.1 hypothetical protein [Streptococcus sp. BJSWXB3CM3]MDY4372083.1 hypothetical protein [Streptococcus sp. BJSWXB6CM1]
MLDNKIKFEEKLTREEIDFLKRNLKTCFDIIVERTGAEEFDVKNKDNFLKEFNPWQKDKGKNLIEVFVDNINKPDSNIDFSWLDILDKDIDKRWNEFKDDKFKKEIKENKKKYTNMRYQIPTHFHGDIDNAVIFHCMENPKGYLGDLSDSEVDDGFTGENLKEFYFYSADIREEESGTVKEIVKERYQLEDVTIDSIEKIIYSKDKSALGREIERIYKQNEDNQYCNFDFDNENGTNKTVLLKDYYYYLKKYYSQLIQTNQELDFQKLKYKKKEVEEIAKKICNLEIYPFACKSPNLGKGRTGNKILLNSDLSRLGAYIVLRRIYRYLNGLNDNTKPIIIFRKYDMAWEKLFINIFDEVKRELERKNQSFENEIVLNLLEKGFFYCQTGSQGGGITDGNVISVPHYRLFLSMKDDAFKEISSLLPRIEVDKKETKIGK